MIRDVLLVGANPEDREAIASRTAALHETFRIVPAADAAEAAVRLQQQLICLTIVDLAGAGSGAVDFVSRAHLDYPDIPLILLGGNGVQPMAGGVCARLSKPVQPVELTRLILAGLKRQADGGIMPGVSPAVFVQLVEMESWTCTMRLLKRDSRRGGILFFREGQLLDARVGSTRGFEAAQHVFTWEDVTLFIENDCVLTTNHINSELQPIIMQAVILKDDPERRAAAGGPRPAAPSPTAAVRLSPTPRSERADDGEEEIDAILDDDLEWLSSDEETLERLDALLGSDPAGSSAVADRYVDPGMTGTIDGLDRLGAHFGLGAFRVGCFQQPGRADVILLSHPSPVVLELRPKSRPERILRVLRRSW